MKCKFLLRTILKYALPIPKFDYMLCHTAICLIYK